MRKRRRKKQKRIIILSMLCLLCIMTAGYAAFQTNINISVKGNIKDLKKEVDNKVTTDKLLFWGQADNKDNTLSVLKNKNGNNDGILNGFNNTPESGYNDGELVFDGVDDYVNIGLANYDFKNSQSLVIYIKINKATAAYFLGNWEGAGGGFFYYNGSFVYENYDGNNYINIGLNDSNAPIINKYYTVIGTYDGNTSKLYIDANLRGTVLLNKLTTSPAPIFIGANPSTAGYHSEWSNISIKEVMIYDRALTENDVKTITEGFEKKYH